MMHMQVNMSLPLSEPKGVEFHLRFKTMQLTKAETERNYETREFELFQMTQIPNKSHSHSRL